MGNPWKSIKLSDYESHMKLDTVMQLQILNRNMYPAAYRLIQMMILFQIRPIYTHLTT